MGERSEKMIQGILDSYREHEMTVRIDEENIINKEIVIEIIEELRKVLFPGYFDQNRVRSEYVKYLVGQRIEFIQYHLKKQVARALGTADDCDFCPRSGHASQADEIVQKFLESIPKIREYLVTDVQAAFDGDPAAYSTDEIIFSYPGIHAITVYRIAHELVVLGFPGS